MSRHDLIAALCLPLYDLLPADLAAVLDEVMEARYSSRGRLDAFDAVEHMRACLWSEVEQRKPIFDALNLLMELTGAKEKLAPQPVPVLYFKKGE